MDPRKKDFYFGVFQSIDRLAMKLKMMMLMIAEATLVASLKVAEVTMMVAILTVTNLTVAILTVATSTVAILTGNDISFSSITIPYMDETYLVSIS